MALNVYVFRDTQEMKSHLNGGISIGSVRNGHVSGLEGKTITFSQPAAVSHTFATPKNGHSHTAAEIRTALETAVAGLKVGFSDGRLVLSGNVVNITGGDALAALGIGPAGAVSRIYGKPGASAPAFVFAYMNNNQHVVVVEE